MVDELIERLKPSEERINRGGGNTVASLNLTEEKLVARLSSRLKIWGNGGSDHSKESSSSSNNKCGRGRGKGHGSGSSCGANHGGGNSGGHAVAVQATTSQALNTDTTASASIGLTNAKRRGGMGRHTLHRLKKKKSPHCSWQAPPLLSWLQPRSSRRAS
jgi:hypothetical protein